MIAIRIKLDKNEIDSLALGVAFSLKHLKPDDVYALTALENLEKIGAKLQRKRHQQKPHSTLSLSITEVVFFLEYGQSVYSKLGAYESAVWHRLNEDVQMKINREIQIRMML